MTLYVDKNVLIPRDDTCAVTQLAIKRGLFLEQDPRVLDLCTGSGCIGLAIANRVKDARVTLADVSRDALAVAKKNITRHKLSARVSCVQADALQPASSFLGKFDMIVSNPPYFIDSLKCPDGQRNTARHTDTLDATRLLESVARLLTDDGRFSIILPAEQTDLLIQTAHFQGLYPSRQTAVITRPGLPPKRILMEFQKTKEAFHTDELIIELERHVYSEGYIALTKDFYLKM